MILMKNLFATPVAILLLWSCSNYHDAQIIKQASTMLQSHPDSCLALLQGINLDHLTSTKQKARYALYMSAALDKNYIDIASDSLISLATTYYSKHGNRKEQMLAWYYNGIVNKNAHSYPSAVVSFEKSANNAEELLDHHHLGLNYRNISSSFNLSNNMQSAIAYMQKAIDCFSVDPSDSLFLNYAKYSLATDYYVTENYDDAVRILNQIKEVNDYNLQCKVNTMFARIAIMSQDNYQYGLSLYRSLPPKYIGIWDYMIIAIANNHLGQSDTADYWLNRAYIHAQDEADSATLDYTKSKIFLSRGKPVEAYHLLNHATTVQDSLTRALLNESVSSAQRDFFREEAKKQEAQLRLTRQRVLFVSIIAFLLVVIIISLLALRSWKKDQDLKELMAQLSVNKQSIINLSINNANLLATHYGERIRRIDEISQDYYHADSETKKDLVFRHFKEYIGNLVDDDAFYQSLEDDLNRYCDGIMTRFRAQIPSIKGRNLQLITLFFAGMSYETVAIITRAQSINSLKTLRSRFRRIIEESNAMDAAFFINMLDMKRQQARITNND